MSISEFCVTVGALSGLGQPWSWRASVIVLFRSRQISNRKEVIKHHVVEQHNIASAQAWTGDCGHM